MKEVYVTGIRFNHVEVYDWYLTEKVFAALQALTLEPGKPAHSSNEPGTDILFALDDQAVLTMTRERDNATQTTTHVGKLLQDCGESLRIFWIPESVFIDEFSGSVKEFSKLVAGWNKLIPEQYADIATVELEALEDDARISVNYRRPMTPEERSNRTSQRRIYQMAELERYVARFPDEAKQVVERNALLGLPATPERAHIHERSPAGGYLTFKSSSYYGYDD